MNVQTTAERVDTLFARYTEPGSPGCALAVIKDGAIAYKQAYGLAVDASGDVIVTGRFKSTVDFGGGPLTSAGSFDVFLAKFDPSGGHVWSQRFGDSGDQAAYVVTADASANVIVTGRFQSTVDFGGGVLTCAGYDDMFVANFDPSGNHIWSRGFGSSLSLVNAPAVAATSFQCQRLVLRNTAPTSGSIALR